MPNETRIRRIGNSAGVTIPKDVLERANLAEGDDVQIIETEDGILVSPYDPEFEEAMRIYREGARRYRNAMRELAE